jgi:outer membrane lipoprotein-sorting protein/predicted Zn-dependent protease
MKTSLLLSLFLTAAAVHGQDSQEARAILERVSQASQTGRSYRAEFTGSIDSKGSGLQQKVELAGTVTFQRPDKLRMEMKMGPAEILMVRDGAEGWIYMPAMKRYTKFAATASNPATADLSMLFGNLTADVQSARLGADESVAFEGVPIRTYLVVTESNPGAREPRAGIGSVSSTLWVDQTSYMVLRRRSTWTTVANQRQIPVETTMDFVLTKLTWDPPLNGSEFTFTPPQGAIETANGLPTNASGNPTGRTRPPASAPRPDAPKKATVIADSLPAYQKMSVASPVITVLKKDELVTVNYSIGASDGTWCSITQLAEGGKSGNVRCDSLKEEPAAVQDSPGPAPAPVPAPVALTLPKTRASHIPRAPLNVRVYFVPIGPLANVDMTYLVGYYKQRFGLTIQTLPAIVLDPRTFNPTRQQNQVEGLIALLERSHPTLANDRRSILIGITEADVYTTSENWVFALGQRDKGRFAVVSSARMDLDHFDYGAPRDPVALHSRLTKMISREIGFLYYRLPLSPDLGSVVRSSIMGVDELDEIGEDF